MSTPISKRVLLADLLSAPASRAAWLCGAMLYPDAPVVELEAAPLDLADLFWPGALDDLLAGLASGPAELPIQIDTEALDRLLAEMTSGPDPLQQILQRDP